MLDDATSNQKYLPKEMFLHKEVINWISEKYFAKLLHVKAPQSHDCLEGWKWVQNYTSEAAIENFKLAY